MISRVGVGLIGFGTVGSGVVKILLENAGLIRRRVGVPIELVRVADPSAVLIVEKIEIDRKSLRYHQSSIDRGEAVTMMAGPVPLANSRSASPRASASISCSIAWRS